jgi:anthranilate phosphoribosyltransferase
VSDLPIRAALARLAVGADLEGEEVAAAFATIMDGLATPAQIGALLMGLRRKGETAVELAGAAQVMRDRARPLRCPDPARGVDTCGTGGDGSGTVNISTLAGIVAAGAGAMVVKHGNRAQSSRSGSADVLEAMGIRVDCSPDEVERCLTEAGIGFAFAPGFHIATRHAAGPRRELGIRTIFNLLGPLTNPARVQHQVVGVFAAVWCAPVAAALGALGARRAFVVHGAGGVDEVAVRGETQVAEWKGGQVAQYVLTPGDFGLEGEPSGTLAGGDAAENAQVLHAVLTATEIDEGGRYRAVHNAAVMEAALALVATGLEPDLRAATERASAALRSGACARVLEAWKVAQRTEAGQ